MYKSINFAVVLLVALIAFSCEKKSDSVIDPSYDSPVILSVTKSVDTVSTTSTIPAVISFDLTAVVSENGGSAIASVNCILVDPLTNSIGTFSLDYVQDLGNGKKYSKTISAGNISCLLVGNYTVQVVAKNEAGLFSAQVNSPLYVKNTANVPPFMSGIAAPDSVVRPLSGSFDITIYASASDPNGSCDIQGLYFNAYRPSGSFIGVIPMTWYPGDSWRFTNPVLPASADSSYGYFRYQFFAKDRSNAVSVGVWDSIKFVRP